MVYSKYSIVKIYLFIINLIYFIFCENKVKFFKMSSGGFYEVINFNDLKVRRILIKFNKSNEEFLKFYINEDFNDIERINYIIKKGYSSQKEAVKIFN